MKYCSNIMNISVCLTTFNGEKFIKEQIDSILAQISENDEVIVSDDGSKDHTLAILQSLNDKRIKIFHNTGRHGFIYNFENALNKAQGNYIFLSDQDDIWLPEKVKIVLKKLNDCDLIVHDAELVDGTGHDLKKNYYSTLHSKTGFLANLWKNRFLGCCMAFRKDVLKDCLPFPNHICGHDFWIGMIAIKRYKVRFIPDILICYRRHGDNVSPASNKSTLSLSRKIVNRVTMLFAVYSRLWLKKA